jgi:hypothetical protein
MTPRSTEESKPGSLSVPPLAPPRGPSDFSGRLLVIGAVLSALLLALSIWLSVRAGPPAQLSAHPQGAGTTSGHM